MSEDRIDALEQQVEDLTEMVREIKRDQHQLEENLRSGLGHAEAHAIDQAKQEIAEEYGLAGETEGEELVEQAFIRGFKRSREGLNGEVFQPDLDEYDGDFEDKLRQYFADDIVETKQDLLDQIDGESGG